MKTYTIGEIHRQGLLKNHRGEPYTNKGTISRLVNRLESKVEKTAWGEAKTLSLAEIERYNKGRFIKKSMV